jgi:hypothetical protein
MLRVNHHQTNILDLKGLRVLKKVDMVRHLNRAHTLFEKGEFHLYGHPVWIVFQYPNQFDEEWNRMMEQLKSDEELAFDRGKISD